jgi:signal transduction histidine kinase
MRTSVKNFTNRFLVVAILIIMAIWALLFYAVIMDEVYDNIDDGLKNQKILIIREAYINSEIIENARDFGINQFRILPVEESTYTDSNQFSKEMIYMPYDEDDEPYRVLRTGFHDQEGNPYKLEIRTSTVEEDDFLFDLGISLAVLYSVIVLSIMVINYLVLTRAWRPFHQILNNLSRYRFGNAKSFQAVPTQVAEFHELNQQIQVMISTNEEVFSSQKRFIENASHELQTPLTIMASKLDLLMQDSTLGENQLVKISEARQSLLRMANLNKSLLMLSRIENKQYMDAEDVNFNEIIKELIEELDYLVEQRGVHVDYEEDGVFMTQCNKELALVLFSNLLRNAIKHNIEIGGRIIIKISASEIRIANSGAAAFSQRKAG